MPTHGGYTVRVRAYGEPRGPGSVPAPLDAGVQGGLCKTLSFQDRRSWDPQVSSVYKDHDKEFCIILKV